MLTSESSIATELAPASSCKPHGGTQTVGELRRWFDVEFTLIDSTSGDLVYHAPDQPARDWSMRAALCPQVVQRNRPTVMDESDPLVVLAIPVPTDEGDPLVAVATFVTREVSATEIPATAVDLLGLAGDLARAWIARQPVWPMRALERLADSVWEKWQSDQAQDALRKEVDNLSTNLASTYEEISLLYRLTQGLRISRREEDLGQMALEWLAEVLPAAGLALQLVPVAEPGSVTHDARTETVVLTHGDCPVDGPRFSRLVKRLGLSASNGPLVLNRAVTEESQWQFPEIRELIVVPLSEGENLFGWLAAFNHTGQAEFGTIEASLLSSVAAILGIHCGNIELYRQQAELLADVVRALVSAIDAKDPYTCGHSDRVARVSVRLAEELGMDAEMLNTIYLCGLLHDIGKIGIDDNVLRKPGKLTDAEFEHIKQHPELGYRILQGLRKLDKVLPAVLHHHENWDGTGYPHGLAGTEIPLAARIVAVADAFDAMGSDRPYRKGMPDEKLDSILRGGAGSQWDARLIGAFFRAREDVREISRRERENLSLDVLQWS